MHKKVLVLLILLLLSVRIFAEEYHVNKNKLNSVKFISDAPVENFEGLTNNIDGYLYFENTPDENSEFYFEVDLRTIDTGIGLRNRHMRENYLETETYPFAIFQGKIIESEKILDLNYLVKSEGEFTVHGISVPLTVEVNLEFSDDNLKISSNFIVKLTDHKIEVPQLMFMKIDESMDIELNFEMIKKK